MINGVNTSGISFPLTSGDILVSMDNEIKDSWIQNPKNFTNDEIWCYVLRVPDTGGRGEVGASFNLRFFFFFLKKSKTKL